MCLVPVVGGLIYGPLVSHFAPEARGHGVPEVMYAVHRLGGRMRPQVPVVKSLASAICIGSGGSVGREGPIVQIGSALGSVLGQAIKLPERQLRLLVACGAAGGISATFNAPIAGVFFALELILGDFETGSFGLVVLSSVTADAIGRAVFGDNPFLHLPPFHFGSPVELLLYAGLGVIATGVGLGFVRVLYAGEDLSDRLWGEAGMAAAGGRWGAARVAVAWPYPRCTASATRCSSSLSPATTSSWRCSAFSPRRSSRPASRCGSAAPAACSRPPCSWARCSAPPTVRRHTACCPASLSAAGAYGLVGMGAVFAAAARAPITAVIIIFELTGDYQIILPLMVAVVVATALSGRLTSDTIYTLKLRRRGIDIGGSLAPGLLDQISVAEAMGNPRPPFPPDSTVERMIEEFAELNLATLPVVSADGDLAGIVTAADLDAAVGETEEPLVVGDLLRNAAGVRANESLESATKVLAAEEDGVPVLAAQSDRLVGWLTHGDLLRAYASRRGHTPIEVPDRKRPAVVSV